MLHDKLILQSSFWNGHLRYNGVHSKRVIIRIIPHLARLAVEWWQFACRQCLCCNQLQQQKISSKFAECNMYVRCQTNANDTVYDKIKSTKLL
jgi:hypothetical protein